MEESDSGGEIGDVKSGDAVVGAVCGGGGDVVDSIRNFGVEQVCVG